MSSKTVMVVDDNASIRAIVSNHLQSDGYATQEAASAAEALQKVAAGGIDMILLDVMMPETDGLEVLRRLKQDPATVTIPVVIISAYGQRENIIRAAREGAVDFIVKPFTRDVILEKVKKYLAPEAPAPSG